MLSVPATDEQLLLGYAACGAPELLAELFRRLNGRLRDFLRGRVFSAALADDLAQETWIRVMLHAGQFHGASKAFSWICAIGKNAAVSTHRKASRKRETLADELTIKRASKPFTKTPADEASRHEEYAALQFAFLGLTDKMREVILLTDIDELDYEDAALALGIPVGTIRSTRHRGMNRLKELMAA